MNERIKLLAEQAGIKIIPLVIDGVEYEYEDVDMDGSEDLEKFAELIVADCVRAVQNRGGMCGALASNWIKEHFGVEE